MTNTGELGLVLGAILGALAGLTLRTAIRSEFARLQDGSKESAASAEPFTVPAWTADFQADEPAPSSRPAVAAEVSAAKPRGSTSTAPAAPARPLPRPVPQVEPGWADKALAAAMAWLVGGNTVVRVGVVVLFIGLSFLAKYAAENAILPLELRLALVGATGVALLLIGFRFRSTRTGYALTLQGAGVAVLYLTVFTSFRLYQLVPAGLALAVMVSVCALSTAIALLQNARALAVVGFAGGFFAPILASTGEGSHVALFSYYTLLNLAIVVVAFRRSWRLLNLLGFFMTFGVATVWGALRYTPENYASTQPFLIAFFLIYVLTAVLYAWRNSTQLKASLNGAVDGTLVFGTPLLAFGLQVGLVRETEFAMAFSALALGAFYLLLASALIRRGQDSLRLLSECFLALGAGFATLAVPLALDARWTAAIWAVEGAAVFWVGMRQARWMPRAFGLLLQGIAALAFVGSLDRGLHSAFALANPAFIGAMLLALPAFAIAWWTRHPLAHSGSAFARTYAQFESAIERPAFLLGFFWWVAAFWLEITRVLPDSTGALVFAWGQASHVGLGTLAYVLSALVAERVAVRKAWRVAAWPAHVTALLLLTAALVNVLDDNRLLAGYGALIWVAAVVTHFAVLRRIDHLAPRRWFFWMHALGVWTLMILLADALMHAVDRAALWRTAWGPAALLVTGTATLLCLATLPTERRLASRWPFSRFADSYAWLAAAPVAAGVFLGGLLVALFSRGNAAPLTYLPLLNPTDLAVALSLGALTLWLLRLRGTDMALAAGMRGPLPYAALFFAAFIAINTVWLRIAHHFAGVPWSAGPLFDSFLVQTGYAILWTLLALGLMVLAHRRARRPLWMIGAGLLGLTLAKLFLVDLSNAGGTERIVAFTAVGVLMLVVGYLAPLPPNPGKQPLASGMAA